VVGCESMVAAAAEANGGKERLNTLSRMGLMPSLSKVSKPHCCYGGICRKGRGGGEKSWLCCEREVIYYHPCEQS